VHSGCIPVYLKYFGFFCQEFKGIRVLGVYGGIGGYIRLYSQNTYIFTKYSVIAYYIHKTLIYSAIFSFTHKIFINHSYLQYYIPQHTYIFTKYYKPLLYTVIYNITRNCTV
ncbi:hypothetical protein NERG_02228, partial [Nematocida ausubeli]